MWLASGVGDALRLFNDEVSSPVSLLGEPGSCLTALRGGLDVETVGGGVVERWRRSGCSKVVVALFFSNVLFCSLFKIDRQSDELDEGTV